MSRTSGGWSRVLGGAGLTAVTTLAVTASCAATPLRVSSVRPISGPVTLTGCKDARAENTPQVAVDPTNPRHLAATYAIGDGTASVLATSRDAGATWTRTPITGTLLCNGGGGHYGVRFDPDLQYGPSGRLYVSESTAGGDSGSNGTNTLVSTVSPGGDALGPPVPVVTPDAIRGAQRGFLAFEPSIPDYADVLTERLLYAAGQYLPVVGSLAISTTTDGGGSFAARTIYSVAPGNSVTAEGLIRHGSTVLAFGELITDVRGVASLLGQSLVEQLFVLRSTDGGQTFGPPLPVFEHAELADKVTDCCLLRPVAAPDGTVYIAEPLNGRILVHRSTDSGLSWQAFQAARYTGVSEPQLAVGPTGTLALSLYELSKDAKTAHVHVLVSGNQAKNWRDMPVGSAFAISSLGAIDDTSPLGPVQGIAATPNGFVAAMTVGGPMVTAGGSSDVDLITIRRRKSR